MKRFHPANDAINAANTSTPRMLYDALTVDKMSFWNTAYPAFVDRFICRADMLALIEMGLIETGGRYKELVRLFNMEDSEYKRFMSFLYKNDCHLPFDEYRMHYEDIPEAEAHKIISSLYSKEMTVPSFSESSELP